jgi:hypothetical protein
MSERTNKIRGSTLGDFLKDPKDPKGDDASNESTVAAAAEAYNPGYPKTDDLALAKGGEKRAPRLEPNAETQDLSVKSLKALSSYAESLTSHNKNKPSFRKSSSPSHERGEPVDTAFVEDSFLWGEADERTDDPNSNFDQRVNFNTQAGGDPAGERLGSFFGATRLNDLLSKTGRPGEPPSNYLLKDHSAKVGSKVSEVLKEVNLYSPSESSPYFDPASDSTDLEKGLWSVQTGQDRLGKDPASNPYGTPTGFDKNAPHITLGAFRSMALKLMLEASGEAGIDDLIGIGDTPIEQFASILAAMNAASLSPGAGAQLGITPLVWDVTRIKGVLDPDEKGGNADMSDAVKRLFTSNGADQFIERDSPSRSGYTINSISDIAEGLFAGPNANLNSWAEPFAGAYPMGMFIATMWGLIGMSLLTTLMDAFMDTAKKEDRLTGKRPDPQVPSTLKMGSWRGQSELEETIEQKFLKMLGFTATTSNTDFSAAVYRGMKLFYGFDFDVRETWAPWYVFTLLDKAESIALSPGYYAIMQRTILRDVSATLEGFAAAAVAGVGNAAVGVLAGGAALGGGSMKALKAVQTHTVIDIWAGSTTFNFMKICVALGDIWYMATKEPGWPSAGRPLLQLFTGDDTKKIVGTERDINFLTPGGRIELSRFYGHSAPNAKPGGKPTAGMSPLSLRLHDSLLLWSANLAPRPPVANSAGITKESNVPDEGPTGAEGTLSAVCMTPTIKGRFRSETVRAYESALDNEYTPFYVHDLRTNELIAMPAFISSVGESFSPEWNETHGYGRTDPVRTYSKTTRTIDLTFTLAAMNKEDMEYMWFVINKLVSMCYPQRSAGKKRTFTFDGPAGGPGRFIQPFSQIPTASPVIRLRLGELFHSNYSLKGLRRLFGDGTTSFDVDPTDDPEDIEAWEASIHPDAIYLALKAEYEAAFMNPWLANGTNRGPEGALWICDAAELVIQRGAPKKSSGGLFDAVTDVVATAIGGLLGEEDLETTEYSQVKLSTSAGVSFRVTSVEAAGRGKFDHRWYAVKLNFRSEEDAKSALGDPLVLKTLSDKQNINAYMRYDSVVGLSLNVCPAGVLEAEQERLLKKGKKAAVERSKKFFSSAKSGGNAIVRSFKATSGRGLAGVITSMNLNYDNATWGTDKSERDRAPKKVEITLGFAPIHDLPLGLDSQGDLVAPSHPVGKALTVNPHDLTIVPKPTK